MAAFAFSGLPEPNKQVMGIYVMPQTIKRQSRTDLAIGSKLLQAANGLSRESSMWKIEEKNQSWAMECYRVAETIVFICPFER